MTSPPPASPPPGNLPGATPSPSAAAPADVASQTTMGGMYGPFGGMSYGTQQVVTGAEARKLNSRKFWLTAAYLGVVTAIGALYIVQPNIKQSHPQIADLLTHARLVLMAYLGVQGGIDLGMGALNAWRGYR